MIFRPLAALLAAATVLTQAAVAQPAQEAAEAFVRTLVADLAEAAQEDTAAVRAVLEDALATEEIGRFLFAGAPSTLADQTQKARYDALFPTFIAASFADQIGELAEREIIVNDVIPRREDETIVRSRLRDRMGNDRARIDWRVRSIEGEPRLLDVLVERVSPLVARRQEFSSIAERQGVDAVIAHMERVIGDDPGVDAGQ